MADTSAPAAAYDAAAVAFLELVGRVPAAAYDGPGLGEWDLRALVGHTGRSLTTVATYLPTRAPTVAAESAGDYFVLAARMFADDRSAITQRGVDAGAALGDDPLATLRTEHAAARAALADLAGDDPVVTTVVGGMRVSDYLPTRTFELTVHGLDVARAARLDFHPTPTSMAAALAVAAESAVALGLGPQVLLALTGRQPWPDGASVVP